MSTSLLKSAFEDATSPPTHLSFLSPLNPALYGKQSPWWLFDASPLIPSYFGGLERGIRSQARSGAHGVDAVWIYVFRGHQPNKLWAWWALRDGDQEAEGDFLDRWWSWAEPWPQADSWYVWKEREFPKQQWVCFLAERKVNRILKMSLREVNSFLLALVSPRNHFWSCIFVSNKFRPYFPVAVFQPSFDTRLQWLIAVIKMNTEFPRTLLRLLYPTLRKALWKGD